MNDGKPMEGAIIMKPLFALLFMTGFLSAGWAGTPVVSNVQATVLTSVKQGFFQVSRIEARFDLADSDNDRCRIWPGLRMLEPGRLLPLEGRYLDYDSVSGDTSVPPGTGYRVRFTVRDTCGFDSARVKITAWDRKGWPPFPNRPFFGRHHGTSIDVRRAPVHERSTALVNEIFLHKAVAPFTLSGGKNASLDSLRTGDSTGGFPIYTVMGNHPKKILAHCTNFCDPESRTLQIPFPHTAVGDPWNAYPQGGKNEGDGHMSIVDVENWTVYNFTRARKLTTGPMDWDAGGVVLFDLALKNYRYFTRNVWTVMGAVDTFRSASYFSTNLAAHCIVSKVCFTALQVRIEEVLDGEIQHPLMFNLYPIASYFVYPALKADVQSNSEPPYGMKIRLRQDYPLTGNSLLQKLGRDSTVARMMLRAMQKYGAILTHGGDGPTLVGEPDAHLPTKWSDLCDNINAIMVRMFLRPTDFQVVDWDWQYEAYQKFPK